MNAVLIYASTHQGNTKKIVDAIKEKIDIEVIDATKQKEHDLSKYDLIGFASGIYAGNYHNSVLNFASVNLPAEKKVFFIQCSAMGSKKYDSSIKKAVQNKSPNILGSLSIKGMTTFGPFKLIGGAPKGRPNEKDLNRAVEFVKEMIKTAEA